MPIPEGLGVYVPLPPTQTNPISNLINGVSSFFGNVNQQVQQAIAQPAQFVNNVVSNVQSYFTQPNTYNYSTQQGQQLNLPGQPYPQYVSLADVNRSPTYSSYVGSTPVNVSVNVQPSPINISLPFNIPDLIGQQLNTVVSNISPQLNSVASVLQGIVSNVANTLNQITQQRNSNVTSVADIVRDSAVQGSTAYTSAIQSTINSLNTSLSDTLRDIGSQLNSRQDTIVALANQYHVDEQTLVNNIVGQIHQLGTDIAQTVSDGLDKKKQFTDENTQNLIQLAIILGNLLTGDLKSFWPNVLEKWSLLSLKTVGDVGSSVNEQRLKLDEIVNNVQQGKYSSWTEMMNALQGTGVNTGLMQGIINIMVLGLSLIRFIEAGSEPIGTELSQLAYSDKQVTLTPEQALIDAQWREMIDSKEYYAEMAKHGINEYRANLTFLATDKRLNEQQIAELLLRGFIDTSSHDELMRSLHYTTDNIQLAKQLYKRLPNPQDIIHIADKRIWSQQTPEKYGQYSEVPDEMIKFLSQYGYDKDFIKWLWAAHWNLPSPNQIFEMYQRGKISEEDMNVYLGLTDWLPFFRDKLLSISYNPITRVDIRRMYKTGILDYDAVIKAYRDVGYSPEDAIKLAQFTVKYEHTNDDDDLTKVHNKIHQAIETSYLRGKITTEEAQRYLKSLGYDDSYISQIIGLVDFERAVTADNTKKENYVTKAINLVKDGYTKGTLPANDTKQSLIALGITAEEADLELHIIELERAAKQKETIADTAKKLYAVRQIDHTDFVNRLNSEGFSADEVNYLFKEAQLLEEQKYKKLTEKQLEKLFKDGVITLAEYGSELSGLGYADKYVNWLIEQDIIQ